MAALTLGLLGSLHIVVADAPITSFESNKARGLLAYLAVESARPHRREALIGLLWPECPEDVARRNLRQALFNVRQAIGDRAADPPYLFIGRDEIQFNPASDAWLDVAQFSALLDRCDRHLPRCVETCSIHAARLQEAIELYRGKFLEEFFLEDCAAFEEWALMQREALHQRALDALVYLANYYELRADYEPARRYAFRQLELDAWREEAHRQLMRVLAASGQRSAALMQYETCRRVLREALGVEPSAETRALYEQISRGASAAAPNIAGPDSGPTEPGLPVPLTPFVGRERELAHLSQLLADPACRLATLVGPGGIGKTRLALQVALGQRESFAHGAAFVSLASVDSTAAIVPAIAEAAGFAFYGIGEPKTQLFSYLRDKNMLLLLDNVEHLVAASALFADILRHAPQVKLLATSREPLRPEGEWVFEVEGLPVPEDERAGEFEEISAVALFLQCARRAHAGFTLARDDRAAVAHICRLVGGMPLALELAAAWVRTLSCGEIAREIESDLDFLTAARRDVPERHRSLRAVFDHSWQMLSSAEQRVLRRLSVFRRGFPREAAEQVAGASLSLLAALVSKSLLRRASGGRYQLHELVRQYAGARLRENAEEASATTGRHSRYYLAWLRDYEAALHGPGQVAAVAALTAEIDNLRVAWEWAVAERCVADLDAAVCSAWYYYELRSLYDEGEAMLLHAATGLWPTAAADEPDGDAAAVARARLQAYSAFFTLRLGDISGARRRLQDSLSLLESRPDCVALADVLWLNGAACWFAGDFDNASRRLREAHALDRASHREWHAAIEAGLIGVVEHERGDYAEAQRWLVQEMAECRVLGDPRMICYAIYQLNRTMHALGRSAEMRPLLREAVQLAAETGDRFSTALSLEQLAQTGRAAGGDPAEASRLLRKSIGLYREIGENFNASRALVSLGNLCLAEGDAPAARECFGSALSMALRAGLEPGALEALLGIATVEANAGRDALALERIVHIVENPAATHDTRVRASAVRMRVEAALTVKEVEAARARARGRSLASVAQEALATSRTSDL